MDVLPVHHAWQNHLQRHSERGKKTRQTAEKGSIYYGISEDKAYKELLGTGYQFTDCERLYDRTL